jgi:response regulator RpfG family c-di-GMP phosphodiesterase
MTYKLLIVDDEKANLRLLERLFRQDYYCLTATSGEEAIQLLNQHDVAILITDQRMPRMSGIELLKRTAVMRPHMARILLTGYTEIEALVEAINCGLVHRYFTKPWNNDELKLGVARALEEYENNRKNHSLQVANERLQLRLAEMKLGVANAFDALLRTRDEYSCEHSARVATQAVKIAELMGISEINRVDLKLAAALHHLAHIGAPDPLRAAIDSPAADERANFQAHSELSARIIRIIPELGNVADLLLFHHENFDGSGSPRGLEGEQIPLACRIMRVTDEYDLLTQPRLFSASLSHDETMRLLAQRAGTEFDPAVVKVLSQLEPIEISRPTSRPDSDHEWMFDNTLTEISVDGTEVFPS